MKGHPAMIPFAKLSVLLAVASSIGAAVPLRAPETEVSRDAVDKDAPDDFYCGERKLGQWFYCAKPKRIRGNAECRRRSKARPTGSLRSASSSTS